MIDAQRPAVAEVRRRAAVRREHLRALAAAVAERERRRAALVEALDAARAGLLVSAAPDERGDDGADRQDDGRARAARAASAPTARTVRDSRSHRIDFRPREASRSLCECT